jgi:hypothetical protein
MPILRHGRGHTVHIHQHEHGTDNPDPMPLPNVLLRMDTREGRIMGEIRTTTANGFVLMRCDRCQKAFWKNEGDKVRLCPFCHA